MYSLIITFWKKNGPYCLIQRKTIKLGRSFSVKTVLEAFSSPLSYFVFCDYYGKLIHQQKWVCPKIHIFPANPESYLSTLLFIAISQSLQHITTCMEHFQVTNFVLLLIETYDCGIWSYDLTLCVEFIGLSATVARSNSTWAVA